MDNTFSGHSLLSGFLISTAGKGCVDFTRPDFIPGPRSNRERWGMINKFSGFSGASADPKNPLTFAIRFWDGKQDAAAIEHVLSSDPQLPAAPLLRAVRDHNVFLAAIMPLCGAFEIPADRQAVVVISDELSLGPDAFDTKSIERFLKRCEDRAILVAARGPKQIAAFDDAARTAVDRLQSVLLVDTTPEQHPSWHVLISQISPRTRGSYVLK
jgi:hypothetical protein